MAGMLSQLCCKSLLKEVSIVSRPCGLGSITEGERVLWAGAWASFFSLSPFSSVFKGPETSKLVSTDLLMKPEVPSKFSIEFPFTF